MKTGVITLTQKQHRILESINKENAGFTTVKEAAAETGLSERQVKQPWFSVPFLKRITIRNKRSDNAVKPL